MLDVILTAFGILIILIGVVLMVAAVVGFWELIKSEFIDK